MDLGSILTGKFKRNDCVFEIQQPFEEVLDTFKFQAKHKIIQITTNLDEIENKVSVCCDMKRIM